MKLSSYSLVSLLFISTISVAKMPPRNSAGILSSLAANSFHSANMEEEAIFHAALQNLDSQLSLTNDGTAYISTGDIPAEWLRDSSVQARPYLFFAKSNAHAAALLKALIQRQAKYLKLDPYANAFRENYSIWEEKFELDSLSYPILLAWEYWKVTGDISLFTPDIMAGYEQAFATMLIEQNHSAHSTYSHAGLSGNPVGATGMIWTGFRPSDDPCKYNFLIPAEMMAVQALSALQEIESQPFGNTYLVSKIAKLKREVISGINKYGIVKNSTDGTIYAYEVDGLGHSLLMDDGNLPNLVGIPFFGYAPADDPIYLRTRRFALSVGNPYFYQGSLAQGLGSPHTPAGMIWPLGLLAQAFSSRLENEQVDTTKMILASDPGDHLLHESFNPNDPSIFTRANFGWPNAMFVEFALTKLEKWPALPMLSKP